MSLEKIIAIAGKPGLFRLVAQTRGGFVAESLMDGKRISVNVQKNVSVLSEIAIYTLTEEVPLKDVFIKIKELEQGKPTSVSPKDSKDKLEEYFFNILPEYDEDRVYVSDIKKVIQWYNILQNHKMLDLLQTDVENKPDEEE
tara:strand:- start:5632 stop:6057 length:426 start_codon:yes stop_codon:yes gene_type:complete